MKFRIPNTYTLIFSIVIIMAALTWIIPSGEFERIEDEKTNKTLVVPGSYHEVEKNPQGIKAIFASPIRGLIDAAEVVGFVLLVGGAFGIVQRTGAIHAGLIKVTKLLSGKELIIIPITMILFGIGGTTFGMCEETLPFYMVFIPLMINFGYDSLTGVAVVFLGAASGVAASTLNPFSVGIAQAIAELTPGSGVGYRAIQFIIFMTISISFVLLYAVKVKRNPKSSIVYELDQKNKEKYLQHDTEDKALKGSHILVLLTFGIGMVIMIYGILRFEWYIEEIAMIFTAIGIISGIVGKLKEEVIVTSFIRGASDLVAAAIIIGLARGIIIVASDGRIIDTILNSASTGLRNLPRPIFISLMLLVQNAIAFLVPSSSGHAALTISIMAPLGDLLKVSRQVTVTAYQYGTGLTNMITPTSGVLMGALGIAGLPWSKWFRFSLPLVFILIITAMIFLILGLRIY